MACYMMKASYQNCYVGPKRGFVDLPSSTPHSCLPCSASSSSEPLEEHQVAQLLRRFSNDPNIGHPLSLDSAFAHHLHQCSYHLRLFRNWLISGQDPLEYLYGQPRGGPSMPCCAVTAVMASLQLFEACLCYWIKAACIDSAPVCFLTSLTVGGVQLEGCQ